MDKGKAAKLFRTSADRDTPLSDAVSRMTTTRKPLATHPDIVNDSATLAIEVPILFYYFHDELLITLFFPGGQPDTRV
jgi:hypothetical protein